MMMKVTSQVMIFDVLLEKTRSQVTIFDDEGHVTGHDIWRIATEGQVIGYDLWHNDDESHVNAEEGQVIYKYNTIWLHLTLPFYQSSQVHTWS